MPELTSLPPAVAAFDAAAAAFDERFGGWASVAAQRRLVRRHLLRAFPAGTRLLELAGGTGEDAVFLARHGRHVTLTDGAPAMVAAARARFSASAYAQRLTAAQLVLEEIETFAADRAAGFDGAYSNFAGLNCVADLRPVARGLARMLPTGAQALLVMFGPLPPGEVVVQVAKGTPRTALRRLRRERAAARIGGHEFHVSYPTPAAIARAFRPWFRLERLDGIGIFVPPSAAEPGISRMPRLLRLLERLDVVASRPLALLGDHVLLHLRRTHTPIGGGQA